MSKTTFLFLATAALSLCLCRAGVIKDNVELQSSLVICPSPGATSNRIQTDAEINEPGHWEAIERTFTFPESGFYARPITCILIQDLSSDGKGGSASTVEGGLNAYRVSIKLRSVPGHALHFNIKIYTA